MTTPPRPAAAERLRVGDLLVDLAARTVHRNAREIPLHPLTFDLLAELVRQSPRTVSHRALMDALWADVFVGDENLKQRVRLLRRALGDDAGDPSYVGTVRGRGYRIVAPVEPLPVRAAAPERDPRRLAVAVFTNRTGRAELDPLGVMAADWIAGGLTRIPGAHVVPSSTSLLVARRLRRVDPLADPREAVARLALESAAGTVVDGAYYLLDGDSLAFHAQVVATDRGWTLCRGEEVRTPLDEPVAGIDRLRERILIAVAERMDSRSPLAGWESRPPLYDAYQRYAEGLASFVTMDFRESLDPLAAAARADPGFAAPRLLAALARWNLGDPAATEELTESLQDLRDRLGPLERLVLDELEALLRGDRTRALDRMRRAARMAPASPWVFEAARQAVLSNLPREAISRLRELDPDHGPAKGWEPYWFYLALAHHALGDHGAELAAAQEARVRHPASPWPRAYELRARIGRGDDDAVSELLDRAAALPAHPTLTPGGFLALASRELLAHGRPVSSRETAERALAWLEDRPASERRRRGHRLEVARASVLAGRLDSAEARFRSLAAETPDEPEVIGWLGVLRARRDDDEAAAAAAGRLAAIDRPYLFGAPAFWRGAIAGWCGRRREAVALLAEAEREGYPFGWPGPHPHEDPALAPLRDDRGFRAWIEPRG